MKHSGNVFHFSGGRTSGLMVMRYWKPGDLVIFCDTGREDEDTYRFVRDFEKQTGIPIIWLKGDFRKDVIAYEQCIPNHHKRKCTLNLKIRKARRYLRSIGWFAYTQFIGFRADEVKRVKDYPQFWDQVKTEFPLYEDGTKKPEVLEIWRSFSWDLKIDPILGNCDLCFEKGEAAIIAILSKYPEKADRWVFDEEDKILNPKGHTYFKGASMRQLLDKSKLLKGDYDLSKLTPKFNCSCTS